MKVQQHKTPRHLRFPSLSLILERTGNDRHNLAWLLKGALLIYLAELAVNRLRIGTSPDSEGYFTAGRNLLDGHPDFFRTPVFPLICQPARLLAGDFAPYIISVILFIILLYSVTILYRTVSLQTTDRRVRFTATALYAYNPAIISWCVEDIGTESLAISGMVFMCYLITTSLLKRPKATLILAISGLTFLLIMLRPFFVCIIPVILLFFLFQAAVPHTRRRIVTAALVGTVAATVAILSYCSAIGHRYGMFTLSKVSSINRAIIVAPEHEMTQQFWTSSEGYKEYIDGINREIALDPMGYVKGRCKEFLLSCAMYYPAAGFGLTGKVMNRVINIPLWFSYAFIAAYFVFHWRNRKQSRPVFRLALLLSLCCCATIFTSVWGAYADYSRLMMPMYPCLCLMSCTFLPSVLPDEPDRTNDKRH